MMAVTKHKGRDAQAFMEAHDRGTRVPKRIRTALGELGEGWLYEGEFMKLAQLSPTDMGAFRDQFKEFWLDTTGHNSKRVWAGTPKFAAVLRAKAQ